MYDMNAGTKAVQLTNITQSPDGSATWYVRSITPSSDCSIVAFRSGYGSYWDVHTVRVSPLPAVVTNVTATSPTVLSHAVFDHMGISKDNSQVFYVTRTVANSTAKPVYTVNGAPAVGNCCKPKVLYTGPSNQEYYYFMGSK